MFVDSLSLLKYLKYTLKKLVHSIFISPQFSGIPTMEYDELLYNFALRILIFKMLFKIINIIRMLKVFPYMTASFTSEFWMRDAPFLMLLVCWIHISILTAF